MRRRKRKIRATSTFRHPLSDDDDDDDDDVVGVRSPWISDDATSR